MSHLANQHKRDDAFSNGIQEFFDHPATLAGNKCLDAFIVLAKETIDPDELMYWFEFAITTKARNIAISSTAITSANILQIIMMAISQACSANLRSFILYQLIR